MTSSLPHLTTDDRPRDLVHRMQYLMILRFNARGLAGWALFLLAFRPFRTSSSYDLFERVSPSVQGFGTGELLVGLTLLAIAFVAHHALHTSRLGVFLGGALLSGAWAGISAMIAAGAVQAWWARLGASSLNTGVYMYTGLALLCMYSTRMFALEVKNLSKRARLS